MSAPTSLSFMMLALALHGCGGGAPPPAAKPAPPPTAPAKPAAPAPPPAPAAPAAPAAARLIQGTITATDALFTFTSCGGATPKPLRDDGALAPILKSLGSPAYLEALAQPADDGALVITQLQRVLPGESRCEGIDWSWIASGTEPFWTLEIAGDKATLHQPDPPPHQDLKVDSRTPEADGVRVRGTTPTGEPFDALFRKGACTNAMSGAWSSHTVAMTLGARKVSGCGAPGQP